MVIFLGLALEEGEGAGGDDEIGGVGGACYFAAVEAVTEGLGERGTRVRRFEW